MTVETTHGIVVGTGTGWFLRPLGWLLGIPHRGTCFVQLSRHSRSDGKQRWERRIGRRRWSTTLAIADDGFIEKVLPGLHLQFRRRDGGADLIGIRLVGTARFVLPLEVSLDDHQCGHRPATTVTVRLGRHRCSYRAELARPSVGEVWR